MTQYSDSPSRANSTNISTGSPIVAGYTELAGDSEILSNTFHLLNTAGLDSSVRCEQTMGTPDHSASVTVSTFTSSATNHNVGACARMSTSASSNFYIGAIVANPGPSYDAFIFRFAANAFAAVVTTGPAGLALPVAGDVLTLIVKGTTQDFRYNGTSLCTGTDATLTTGNFAGFYYARATSGVDVAISRFDADDGMPPPRFSQLPVYRM